MQYRRYLQCIHSIHSIQTGLSQATPDVPAVYTAYKNGNMLDSPIHIVRPADDNILPVMFSHFRECFFTLKDVKSTTSFTRALNESLESGALMCQLYNVELSKYVMGLTNAFCREQKQHGRQQSFYVKNAAVCLGQQPSSKVWVLSENAHFNEDGDRIEPIDSNYIWLGTMVGRRQFNNVAPATDTANIPFRNPPGLCLDNTLASLKSTVNNNYLPAFFLIASACMSIHYESIMDIHGMCPTPVAVGPKNTG